MSGYTPPLDSALSLTIHLGYVNVNASAGPVSPSAPILQLDPANGWASLAAVDVGDIVMVMGGGPGGAPLWTTIAAVNSATQAVLAHLDTLVGQAPYGGAQATIFRPLTEETNNSVNYIENGTIDFEKSLTTRPTLNFTIYSGDRSIVPTVGGVTKTANFVGMPVLMTDSSLTSNPFGGENGDVFGGSIEQAKASNYPGQPWISIECECVSWDAIASRRLLVLAPGFQTSPGYQSGQQVLTFNGNPWSTSNPMGVQTGLAGPPSARYFPRWFSIWPPPVNITLIKLNGTAVAFGPYVDLPPLGPGGYDFYWSAFNNPALSIDPSVTINSGTVVEVTVDGTAASGGDNIVPNVTYNGLDADVIATALINLIAVSEGISIAHVVAGPNIPSIAFQANQTLDQALSSLCEYISGDAGAYWWYIDPRKGFHFEIQGSSNPAPWNIEESDGSDGNVLMAVSDTVTREKYYNSDWLDLSTLSNSVSVYCQGNGTAQSFALPYPMGAAPTVTLYDGVAPNPVPTGSITNLYGGDPGINYSSGDALTLLQDGSGNDAHAIVASVDSFGHISTFTLGSPGSGYDFTRPMTSSGGTGSGATWSCLTAVVLPQTVGNVGQTGFDYYWALGASSLHQDLGNPAITSGQFLLVTYAPVGSTFTQFIDPSATKARQLIEGGSGEYDQYLNIANTLPLVQGAPAQVSGLGVAQSLAALFSTLAEQVDVSTYRNGLAPGMSIDIDLPGIAVGTAALGDPFVIQSVKLSDEGKLQLWKITAISGAIVGDWKTAIKFFTGGGTAPPPVVPTSTPTSSPGWEYVPYTSAFTPNYNDGATQLMYLNGDTAVGPLSNVPGSGEPIQFIFVQDATGGHSIAWDSSYAWGSAPVLPPQPNPIAGSRTVYNFKVDSGGNVAYISMSSDTTQ